MNSILRKIAELKLPFVMDADTPGSGNCFFEAVLQQSQRPDLGLLGKFRSAKVVRRMVCAFALSNNDAQLVEFIKNFNAISKVKWAAFFRNMRRDGVWADAPVTQVTAWLLDRDIWVVSEGNIPSNPYMVVYGTVKSPSGLALILGNVSSVHFQSFLPAVLEDPLNSESVTVPPKKTLFDTSTPTKTVVETSTPKQIIKVVAVGVTTPSKRGQKGPKVKALSETNIIIHRILRRQQQINDDIQLLVNENRKLHALYKKGLFDVKMLSPSNKIIDDATDDVVDVMSPVKLVEDDVWASFTQADDEMDIL